MCSFVNSGYDISTELCTSRHSFFEAISLFVPGMQAAVVDRYRKRDARLVEEAENAVNAYVTNRGPGESETRAWLNTELELQRILCMEYRYVWPLTKL